VSETIKQLKIRKWITVPGNHDVFGSSSRRLYREYGMHPPLALNETYSRTQVTNIRGHMLFGLDAALNPSPHRPMNFFGMVTTEMEDDLLKNLREHRARGSGGASVVFGHYPSALMASGKAIGRAFAQVDAEFPLQPSSNMYLSGHLHDLKGYARHGLQASSNLGHLELQLPDMFTTGSYRILVVDHGLPTWKDFRLSEQFERLTILVTNPTGSAVSVAGACYAALKSTHVRFLVFPNRQRLPEGFAVAIDGISVGIARRLAHDNEESTGVVYAVPWNSREYYGDKRSHVLEVRDQSSNEVLLRHVFTLSGQLVRIEQWARWNAFVGAFFSLSEFDKIARTCVWLGLSSATCICLVTLFILQRLCHGPVGILICSCAMMVGPLLVSQDLTEQGGWGWISLRMVNVKEGALKGGVDPYFSMFLIVFTSIVPSAYLCLVAAVCPDLTLSFLIRCTSALSCAQCVRWVLTIAGAHGIRASIISPSCVPLLITLINCHTSQMRLPIKRKRG
jgi:Calcineurin-like phosphoesterase